MPSKSDRQTMSCCINSSTVTGGCHLVGRKFSRGLWRNYQRVARCCCLHLQSM